MGKAAIRVRHHDGVAVVTLSGNVERAVAADLERELAEVQRTVGDLIVDLGAVNLLDAFALRALLVAEGRAARAQQQLALVVRPASGTSAALEFVGLGKRLPLFASYDVARAALEGSTP